MIVLTEIPLEYLHSTDEEMASMAVLAQEEGAELRYLPSEGRKDEISEVFASYPPCLSPQTAVWKGTIPSFAYYRSAYELLAEKNIFLINSPEEHRMIFEFHRAYPHIQDLTARSWLAASREELHSFIPMLEFPVFVKGDLLSLKHLGWSLCVAHDAEQLEKIAQTLWSKSYFSRGLVVVREWIPFLQKKVHDSDIPASREFRVFVCDQTVVGYGYYWGYFFPFSLLEPEEEASVLALAKKAAARFSTPLISLDIGQREDGSWIVVETGDPQFSGLSLMSGRDFWRNLQQIVAQRKAGGIGRS